MARRLSLLSLCSLVSPFALGPGRAIGVARRTPSPLAQGPAVEKAGSLLAKLLMRPFSNLCAACPTPRTSLRCTRPPILAHKHAYAHPHTLMNPPIHPHTHDSGLRIPLMVSKQTLPNHWSSRNLSSPLAPHTSARSWESVLMGTCHCRWKSMSSLTPH